MGPEALVADALASLTGSDELALDVGRPPLDEATRPRLEVDSGATLARVLKPVLAATSCDANSVDVGADLLNAVATMSPDAVRLAYRGLIWDEVLRRAADSGRYVLIEGCTWEVSDDETLELKTVRDAVTAHDVAVPPGLGVLAYIDTARYTPAGEGALGVGTTALRLNLLGRPRALNDLAPDLLVILELNTLAIWPSV
jgi:hypothetical protein